MSKQQRYTPELKAEAVKSSLWQHVSKHPPPKVGAFKVVSRSKRLFKRLSDHR